MDTLARNNAHPRDAAISFDEPTHIYTIAHDAAVRYTSVTTLNGSLFDHFDGPAVAAKVAAKPNWKRNKVEYHNKTAAELVAMWAASGEEASRLGTAMHLDIERFYNGLPTVAAAEHAMKHAMKQEWNGSSCVVAEHAMKHAMKQEWNGSSCIVAEHAMKHALKQEWNGSSCIVADAPPPPPPPTDSVEMGYFHRFWNNWRCGHLTPWRTEWCVYWEEYRLAGSIDMVFRDPIAGTLEIYDWKRVCKPLEPEHDNPRFPKFAKVDGLRHLPDNAYWHYALQLNMYKRILETQYGEKVTALTLVVLHPNNPDFRRVELPFLPNEIDAVLRHRRNELFPSTAGVEQQQQQQQQRQQRQTEEEEERADDSEDEDDDTKDDASKKRRRTGGAVFGDDDDDDE